MSCASVRRSRPSFLHMPEPPTWGAEWERQTYREHLDGFSAASGCCGNALPAVTYVAVGARPAPARPRAPRAARASPRPARRASPPPPAGLKLAAYVYVFERYARDAGPLLGEQNFVRFLLYNMLGDLLGANATWGPLAFRLKWPVVTWYNLLKPGTFSRPLLPGVAYRRRRWQCAGYALLVALLARALRADRVGVAELWPPAATLAVLTPFDFVTFSAARGEHYGYMLVCCCFGGGDAVVGCQLVQAALWFFAGLSKCGPWFDYLNQFMMPNGLAMRATDALGVLRYGDLFVDAPRDRSPSALARRIAAFGRASELLLAPLAMFAPGVGVPLALGFHAYIISMLPFASVNEWNVACVYFCVFLFRERAFDARAVLDLDARLASFLFVVLLVVPVYGQLFPKRVPFLTAYRPYAGNWCFSWHVVAGAAKAKLAKLDVLDGTVLLSENAKLLWGSGNPHLCEQMEDYVTGILTCFPAYRPVVPMVEQLKAARGWAGHGDCLVLNQEMLGNHIFGFCLGTGFLVKGDGYLDALRETCGFESGECFLIVCEPAGLLDHTVEWRAVDVATKETVIRGAAPYAALEAFQPCAMTRAHLDAFSTLPKRE